MPKRPYHVAKNFTHLENILRARYGSTINDGIKFFRERQVAPITNSRDISLFLGIDYQVVHMLSSDESKLEYRYRKFELRKRNGSKRTVYAPRTYLKVIQWWILDNILNRIDIDNNVFGFVPKRNIVQNAKFHHGAKHILNVDIKDFFPSIKISQVNAVFLDLGYNEEVSIMLSQICCLDDRVPQGAPTSPVLGNLVLRNLDKELTHLSRQNGMKYSRYADDLTFSSSDWIDVKILKEISVIVQRSGFTINSSKTRFAGPQDRLEVTGVVINDKIQPRRKWRKFVRATLHRYGKQERLTRRQLAYLFGIVGVAGQYPDNIQMTRLSNEAKQIVKAKRNTIVDSAFPSANLDSLTEIQAEALNQLSTSATIADISKALNVSESTVKRALREAYVVINVNNRDEAMTWINENR